TGPARSDPEPPSPGTAPGSVRRTRGTGSGWSEGSLEPHRRDDRVVAQAGIVERVDAVREHHDPSPDDRAGSERKVEEVVACEVDAEQRAERGPTVHQVEEIGLSGRRAALELAAAEEGEREPKAVRHVHAAPTPVAALLPAAVVGEEVVAAVGERLVARPHH